MHASRKYNKQKKHTWNAGHVSSLARLKSLLVHANRQLSSVHLIRMHNIDRFFSIGDSSEFNSGNTERLAIGCALIYLAIDDRRVAALVTEEVLELGPFHLVRDVRDEYGAVPAVLQVVLVVFDVRRSVWW